MISLTLSLATLLPKTHVPKHNSPQSRQEMQCLLGVIQLREHSSSIFIFNPVRRVAIIAAHCSPCSLQSVLVHSQLSQ